MKNLNARERFLISFMICVGILVFSFLFIFKPIKGKIAEAEQKYESIMLDKQNKDDVINGRQIREENIGNVIGNIEKLERTYAIQTTHENMDIAMTSLSQSHNLITTNFKVKLLTDNGVEEEKNSKPREDSKKIEESGEVKPGEKEEEVEKIHINENGLVLEEYKYSLTGDFEDLLKFIEDLNSDSKIQIPDFSLTYTGNPGADSLNIPINIKELGPDYIFARDTVPDQFKYLAENK